MAIGKAETTVVLGLLSLAIAGAVYATASFARLPPAPAPNAPEPRIRQAAASDVTLAQHAPTVLPSPIVTDEMRSAALRKGMEAKKRDAKKQGVRIGMTQADVIGSAWGKPSAVNKTLTANGEREQWIYGNSGNYLYFDNGTLTTIQTGQR